MLAGLYGNEIFVWKVQDVIISLNHGMPVTVTLRLGNIVGDKENILQTAINESIQKFVCNFWTVLVCTNKKKISGQIKMEALIIRRVLFNWIGSHKVIKVPKFFWKAVLLFMYGSAYPPHFGNARSEIMKQFVTLKAISKINTSCL